MSAPAWADPLVVDGASLGGACSDARAPAGVSLTTPWCTIVQAVKAAPSGSTVFVRGGSYPYQLLHGLGSRSDYVTFEPYGYDSGNPETVTIAGISTANTGFLRFQGFHLLGDDSSGFVPAARIYLYSHDIQFVDNEMTGEGVFLQTAAHVLIEGNHIHDLKRNCNITQVGDGGGIFLIGANSGAYPSVDIRVLANRVDRSLQDSLNLGSISNLVVDRNDFSTGTAQCGDHTDLVQIEGGAMGPITITDNLFHDGGQFILRNATGLRIENNLILRVNQWMQLMADPGARVVNNTWYGGNTYCTGCGSLIIRDYAAGSSWTQAPFYYTNHMTGSVIENNIMRLFANSAVPAADYHEDYDLIYGPPQNSTGIQGAHTMFAQPAFVDTAAGDYHLLSGSPGIDSADAAAAPALDMLGSSPADDPSVADTGGGPIGYRDIGALETQFALAPPPPTDGGSTSPPSSGGGSKPSGGGGHGRHREPRVTTIQARPAKSTGNAIALGVGCSDSCTITATGWISPASASGSARKVALRTVRTSVLGGRTARLGVPLPSRIRAIAGRVARVTLRLSTTDPDGLPATKTVSFRLRLAARR